MVRASTSVLPLKIRDHVVPAGLSQQLRLLNPLLLFMVILLQLLCLHNNLFPVHQHMETLVAVVVGTIGHGTI